MTTQLTEEEEKAKNLGKVKNKQEMMMVDLEGKQTAFIIFTQALMKYLQPYNEVTNCRSDYVVIVLFLGINVKLTFAVSAFCIFLYVPTSRTFKEGRENATGAGEGQT